MLPGRWDRHVKSLVLLPDDKRLICRINVDILRRRSNIAQQTMKVISKTSVGNVLFSFYRLVNPQTQIIYFYSNTFINKQTRKAITLIMSKWENLSINDLYFFNVRLILFICQLFFVDVVFLWGVLYPEWLIWMSKTIPSTITPRHPPPRRTRLNTRTAPRLTSVLFRFP